MSNTDDNDKKNTPAPFKKILSLSSLKKTDSKNKSQSGPPSGSVTVEVKKKRPSALFTKTKEAFKQGNKMGFSRDDFQQKVGLVFKAQKEATEAQKIKQEQEKLGTKTEQSKPQESVKDAHKAGVFESVEKQAAKPSKPIKQDQTRHFRQDNQNDYGNRPVFHTSMSAWNPIIP